MKKIFIIIHSLVFWFLVFFYAAVINKISFIIALFIRDEEKRRLFYHKGARLWGSLLVNASLIKVNISGLENIPNNVNVIFAPNHQSYIDIFILLKYLPTPFRFVIMRKLFKAPFIGDHITRAGYISLDTKDRKRSFEIIYKIIELLKNSNTFVIFPEGKLTADGNIGDFARGVSLIIQSSRKAVVPIAIDGSFSVLPKGAWKLKHGEVRVSIGKPVYFEDYKKINKESSKEIGNKLKYIIEDLKKGRV